MSEYKYRLEDAEVHAYTFLYNDLKVIISSGNYHTFGKAEKK